MKRYFLILATALIAFASSAQTKTFRMMVFPADIWCNQHDCLEKVVDGAGKTRYQPDYRKVLINSNEMVTVIHQVGKLMQDRGFSLYNLEESMDILDEDGALEAVDEFVGAKTQYDKIVEQRKPDVALFVHYYTQGQGDITYYFYITAKDTYTGEEVAHTGTMKYGPVRGANPTDCLLPAVNNCIDPFVTQLTQHIQGLQSNGRKIKFDVVAAAGWEDGLETEVGGKELTDFIHELVISNAVKQRAERKSVGINNMTYNPVYIKLQDNNGGPLDAYGWARTIRKALKDKGVPAKVVSKGLGHAELRVGKN